MKNWILTALAFCPVLAAELTLIDRSNAAEGQDPSCLMQNGNLNGDQILDLSDAVYSLMYLFAGGPAPAPQFASNSDCTMALLGELTICKSSLEDTRLALKDAQKSLANRDAELSVCRAELEACRSIPRMPATGQTTCYDLEGVAVDCFNADYPGQDGFYQAGCRIEGRFIDSGNNTVTDNCTGLMWQKGIADTDENGSSGIEDRLDWQKALKYCENLHYAGFSDWRLPNLTELESICNHGDTNLNYPIFDFNTVDGIWTFWSSTTFIDSTSSGLIVIFGLNSNNISRTIMHPKWKSHYVRAVRGGPH
jgi:uncharacterized protein DUF1566